MIPRFTLSLIFSQHLIRLTLLPFSVMLLCLPKYVRSYDYAYDSTYYSKYQPNYMSQHSGSGRNGYEYGSGSIDLTCYKCESNQQNSACTTGVTNLEDDFMGEERCPTSTSNTGQINTRSYCYVWQYSMGDGLTIYRGCASTENNPCVGPNYSVCHYRLCETSYCNSSSRLSPPPFLTQMFKSVFVTLVLSVLIVNTIFF